MGNMKTIEIKPRVRGGGSFSSPGLRENDEKKGGGRGGQRDVRRPALAPSAPTTTTTIGRPTVDLNSVMSN